MVLLNMRNRRRAIQQTSRIHMRRSGRLAQRDRAIRGRVDHPLAVDADFHERKRQRRDETFYRVDHSLAGKHDGFR